MKAHSFNENFCKNIFFTEHLWWLLLENLFRLSRERRLHIAGIVYAVICYRLHFLLLQSVSSCIWRTLMFGCLSYLYEGDQTETAYMTKSTSLCYLAITCYWRCFCSHWRLSPVAVQYLVKLVNWKLFWYFLLVQVEVLSHFYVKFYYRL